MNRLTIYKASAGSGKTFRLTGEYLKLIFNPETRFYNILAVTFTNKATAEMRERILKALHELATNENAEYAADLKETYNLNSKQVAAKAKQVLNQILYSYSRFNISTIDSFFQKILKAFAYETGLSSGFNVELNLKSILEISIEKFFENISSNKALNEWLSNYAIQKIQDGKSWDIEKDILAFSMDAFNEVFFSFTEEQLKEYSNIENFSTYKKKLSTTINDFVDQMKKFGEQASKQIHSHQLEITDFTSGKSGVMGYLDKLKYSTQFSIKEPGVRVLKAYNSADGIEGWSAKTSKKQSEILACVNSGLQGILKETVDYFNANFELFSTAKAIWRGIDVFAVVVEVYNQMNAYSREKNIFLLPLASPLLSKMIGEDDAPFIYEKTGEYLQHFMIDEFQDTSKIQWENFSPLFLNGISQDHQSLVVGDVKQSIYRWRNGDWTLLNHQLEQRFSNFGVKQENLENNWRSTPEVIEFNNAIFANISDYAHAYLIDKQAPTLISDAYHNLITDIYKSAVQQIPGKNKDLKGQTRVHFLNESKDTEENTQWYLNRMLDAITELIDNGTQPKDIAIIVRRWKEGALVAKHLMEHIQKHPDKKEQFSFVSNDSVLLGSSSIILLLISLLEFILNNQNKESRSMVLYYYLLLSNSPTEAAYKLSEIDTSDKQIFLESLPKKFSETYKTMGQLPFPAIINKLLNIFIYPNNNDGIKQQLPFIQSFQDVILNFAQNNGSDIATFLTWWKEFGIQTPINLSEDQNAIRIITIHKSKGLEYKAVIIPFANWGLDQLPKYIWSPTPEEFNDFSIVPILYSSSLAKSKFNDAYWNEKNMALMDNLNLLYVAFTRAIESLYVFAPKQTKQGEYRKISDFIFSLIENNKVEGSWDTEQLLFSNGEAQKESKTKIDSQQDPINFESIQGERNLKIRLSNNEFFMNDEGKSVSKINMGSVYHKIMENIISIEDIDSASNKVFRSGLLSQTQANNFAKHLKSTLTSNPKKSWFNNSYKVLNESAILLSGGLSKRPDRVLMNENELIVIDYKFTSNKLKSHITQVKEYMRLIEAIENKSSKGFVWYVLSDELIKID